MIKTKQQTKTESFLDLKAKERIKIFRSNELECVLDVNSIDKNGVDCYVKNSYGTRRVYLPTREFRFFGDGMSIYNFGSRSLGQRVHIKLTLPRFYEWSKQ